MSKDLLKSLNKEQRAAVEKIEGPMLVLAGAGSGKTRCITYRVAHLIKDKLVSPDRILLVTFTNKAAGEMKERIKNLVGEVPTFAGTFHSLCARILRREGARIGIDNSYLIYDTDDQVDLVKQVMARLNISQREYKPRSVLATISGAKNELVSAQEYPQYARGNWQKQVAAIYLEYQKALKNAEALDFDDLLMKTVELFQREPEVLGKYQNQWQYVLVDEYQDTNQAQYVLTKLAAGRWRNLCCVGDFSQSVYKWRGADFRNLERLKQEFGDIKTFNLEQNYRSTQAILDAAYGVISKNTTHPVLNLWTDQRKGSLVGLYEAQNEKDEASFIVETINSSKLKAQSSKLSDFAVLYRTNAQSRAIEEALIRGGVPYVLVGGVRFYQRKEVKDCLAYLRLVANPKDSVSFERAQKIGKRRLEKFLEFRKKITKEIDTRKKPVKTVEIFDGILEATKYLDKFDQKDEEDLARLENIKELRSVAAEFEDIRKFLENVALVEQDYLPGRTKGKNEKDVVTLMTLHSAKGLEFETVFLVGMEEGLFPHSRTLMDKEELEEERRLAYVGITRAKRKLYLSYARRRLFFGLRNNNMVSRFVGEIPEHLLEPVMGGSYGLDDDYDLDY